MSVRGVKVCAVGVLAVTLFAMVAETAAAQFRPPFGNREQRDRRDARPEPPKLPPMKMTGTVEAVAPGWLQVTSGNGDAWRLQVLPSAKVKLFGTATPEFLAAGQFISFTAPVDKSHGRVTEPISKLTIFTPDETHLLGAFPAGAGESAPGGGGELAAPAEKTQPEAKQEVAQEAAAAEPFQISGRLSSVKNGKLTIVAPNTYFKGTLKAELADEPEISLDLAGAALFGLAKKGDQVEVSGGQLAPQVAQVTEMAITLVEPLAPKEKKRKGEREKGRKGDEPDEPKQ